MPVMLAHVARHRAGFVDRIEERIGDQLAGLVEGEELAHVRLVPSSGSGRLMKATSRVRTTRPLRHWFEIARILEADLGDRALAGDEAALFHAVGGAAQVVLLGTLEIVVRQRDPVLGTHLVDEEAAVDEKLRDRFRHLAEGDVPMHGEEAVDQIAACSRGAIGYREHHRRAPDRLVADEAALVAEMRESRPGPWPRTPAETIHARAGARCGRRAGHGHVRQVIGRPIMGRRSIV